MRDDSRNVSRHLVRMLGKIILADEPYSLDCLIKNMSEDGALVQLLLPSPLPEHVLLWEERTHIAYDCEVRWQTASTAGLQFLEREERGLRRARLHLAFVPLADPDGSSRPH
jgi:hypothetical protein